MSARIGSSGDESPSFVCVRCFCSSCCFRCSSTQIYERERERGVCGATRSGGDERMGKEREGPDHL